MKNLANLKEPIILCEQCHSRIVTYTVISGVTESLTCTMCAVKAITDNRGSLVEMEINPFYLQ